MKLFEKLKKLFKKDESDKLLIYDAETELTFTMSAKEFYVWRINAWKYANDHDYMSLCELMELIGLGSAIWAQHMGWGPNNAFLGFSLEDRTFHGHRFKLLKFRTTPQVYS